MASTSNADLLAVKAAGFTLANYGELEQSSYIAVSCRLQQADVSNDQALVWGINHQYYFVLAIRFPEGYRGLSELINRSPHEFYSLVQFRCGKSKSYKPEHSDLQHAFGHATDRVDSGTFEDLIMSTTFKHLLNTRIYSFIKSRLTFSFSWAQSELLHQQIKDDKPLFQLPLGEGLIKPCIDPEMNELKIVSADQMQSKEFDVSKMSLPLVCMQYTLQRLIKCADFCMVCHREVDEEHGGGCKPYVCQNSKCRRLYLVEGFGMSLEHEVDRQFITVEVLMKLCFEAAHWVNLQEMPLGLGLKVPHGGHPYMRAQKVREIKSSPLTGEADTNSSDQLKEPKGQRNLQPYNQTTNEYPRCNAVYHPKHCKLIPTEPVKQGIPDLKVGDWIIISLKKEPGNSPSYDTSLCNVKGMNRAAKELATKTNASDILPADFDPFSEDFMDNEQVPFYYLTKGRDLSHGLFFFMSDYETPVVSEFSLLDQPFDEMDEISQCQAIMFLLQLVPSAPWMTRHVRENNPGGGLAPLAEYPGQHKLRTQQPTGEYLAAMYPSGLTLIRWIVASNRTCILQVEDEMHYSGSYTTVRKGETRVHNMNGYLQFRIIMGPPAKERRFHQAMLDNMANNENDAARENAQKYPTLFAFHGSPIFNWHKILRTELDYRKTQHGRTWGHGVYFARKLASSAQYCSLDRNLKNEKPETKSKIDGAQTHLNLEKVICMAELVNNPKEFQSETPYFVVNNLNWIQPRMLFVQTRGDNSHTAPDVPIVDPLAQDPTYDLFIAPDMPHVVLPQTVVPESRRPRKDQGGNTDWMLKEEITVDWALVNAVINDPYLVVEDAD